MVDMHSRTKDMIGKVFGRLTIVSFAGYKNRAARWNAQCACGKTCEVFASELKRECVKSCGCQRHEFLLTSNLRHGKCKTPIYKTWVNMKTRCLNKNGKGYHLYGGRGISVCDEWMKFDKFYEDMGPTWAKGLSIDRINNDLGYFKENCRWTTMERQQNNRRSNIRICTPAGILTVSEASRKFNLPVQALYKRIQNGWLEQNLLLPVGSTRPNYMLEQEQKERQL